MTPPNDRPHPIPAVGALIIQDEEILLVCRGKEPANGLWSIPGGSMEWGETMAEAVRREVLEETGLTVEVGELAWIGDIIVKRKGDITFDYVLIDYFATVVSGQLQAGSDATDVRWVPLAELHAMPVTPSLLELLAELKLTPPPSTERPVSGSAGPG